MISAIPWERANFTYNIPFPATLGRLKLLSGLQDLVTCSWLTGGELDQMGVVGGITMGNDKHEVTKPTVKGISKR